MNDVGKISISDEILNKPGSLTPDEFEIIKTHSQIGYEILNRSQSDTMKWAAIIAWQHHEKYDGTGYPQGLKGEDIHIFGRIVAIADVFDALAHDSVYKKAWDLDKILAFYKEERGKHFDPVLVDTFLENIDEIIKIKDSFQNEVFTKV
jgi:response regulator RpfG family c-di-GMP phosphodiesterase